MRRRASTRAPQGQGSAFLEVARLDLPVKIASGLDSCHLDHEKTRGVRDARRGFFLILPRALVFFVGAAFGYDSGVGFLRELGSDPPRRFELGNSTLLGRDSSCTIVLDDPLVSRTHCEIRRGDDGRFVVVDLGSTHGTFVATTRVNERVLEDGDTVTVGATRLRFELPLRRFSAPPVTIATETQAQALQHGLAVVEAIFPDSQSLTGEADVRRQYDKLRAAYELSRTIGGEDDLDLVLEGIVDCAFRMLAADRVAILLVDAASSAPTPKLVRRRGGGEGGQIVLSRTILNDVIQKKTGVVLLDATSDTRYGAAKSVMAEGIRSAMCVPMLHGGELLGVMHMDSLMATHVFSEHDLEIFSSIASQAALLVKNVSLRNKLQSEAKTRIYLQRFLSPSVVEEVLGGKYQLGHGGELREVTVLFSDIRGFTALTERQNDPKVIVELLNDYFAAMIDTLFRHGGTFDKYVGDELMALFGAPVPMTDAPLAAVACALDMLRDLEAFNARRVAQGKFTIQIGIGVHTGVALCGTMGSRKAMQYTAIGDTVNTGARLCGVAQAGQVIITEGTMAKLFGKIAAEKLESVKVKGKANELSVYNVLRVL